MSWFHPILHFLPYAGLGAVTGFLVGLTGVGGGALMTPALILFGLPAKVAVGTDLFQVSITKGFAVWRYHRKQLVQWRIVRRMCLGSLPAGLLVIGILHSLPSLEKLDLVIQHGLGVALLLVALFLIFKERIMGKIGTGTGDPAVPGRRTDRFTTLAGALLGVMITLTSVGAGALGMVIILLCYPRLHLSQVVGTDLSQALPIALLGALGHLSLGHLDLGLLVALLVGSLPAVALASRLATRVPEKVFRYLLAALLTGIGGRMIIARLLLYF